MLNGLLHPAFIGPGGPELLMVMLVLLILFGAKDAPRMFRKMNEFLSQVRSTAEHFKREIMYSDIAPSPKSEPDRTEGEYDDYGLSSDGDDTAAPVEPEDAGSGGGPRSYGGEDGPATATAEGEDDDDR
jgi:Sec-independent protein translocase protein TatA